MFLRAYEDSDVSKEQAAIENQNLQKIIPRYIKDVYPHKITFISLFEPINKPYIYKVIKGFLYITEKPCGIHSFRSLDCSSVDYSIAFYVIYGDEKQNRNDAPGFLTQQINAGMNYILSKEYNKIEAIYPNIKEQLQDKSYLILPIKIQIKTTANINEPVSPVDIITISTILKPNPQENREILSQYKDICKNFILEYKSKYCSNNQSGERIYIYSKDMYVNVRKKS